MKNFFLYLILIISATVSCIVVAFATVCTDKVPNSNHNSLIEKYTATIPLLWGENVPGVKTRLATTKKVVALTLDLCGAKTDGCDYRYVNFFKEQNIPATLFVSNQWIERHPEDFKELIACPLFDIQNHGLKHCPCSVNGKSIYGIAGTASVEDVIEEIDGNADIIEKYTGKRPTLYRSGTAYYDEVAVQIAGELNHTVLGFDVLGDAGGTLPAAAVKAAVLSAQPGSIIILHMNRPQKECALGALEAFKDLEKQGFCFVHISDGAYKLE